MLNMQLLPLTPSLPNLVNLSLSNQLWFNHLATNLLEQA